MRENTHDTRLADIDWEFSGVIVHEVGHVFFCKAFGVQIHEVCYFRLGNPAGYAIHDDPRDFKQSFFISVGSFIVGNAIAIIVLLLFRICLYGIVDSLVRANA